ncbi:non-ribosomal peptide synthetase [Saccharothrix obliqua]|uniref:non-ribosomal peptide synthetase n=1 Tax=Saccharothrix obliqua TaxID=2861747 RepID=UPI001C5F7137|nr:non-ribosomal peptide synthetase [Saccharothrix obliqua]MBW4718790.1 amino acid adenylation domain-containing protein [Saccharothrix obliqua]
MSLPLSFPQERLWFLDVLRPGGSEYLLPLALHLGGDLDVPTLAAALATVVSRHEVLRTRYPGRGGTPEQVVDEPGPVALPVVDAAPDEVAALVEAELAHGFDLAAQWPLRARLLRLSPVEHVLVFVVHHIAFDGWSWDVFARELAAAYGGARLPEPPVQYADFAAWQRESAVDQAGQLAFWRERLAGLAPLELPADRPRPAEWDPAGAAVRVAVPAGLAGRLADLGRARRATPFMVLLAAYKVFLHRHTGGTDIAVGCPVAGRPLAEVEDLVGLFVNTLVLRTDLGGDPTFERLLDRVADTALAAFSHEDVPFERLVAEFEPDRDLSRNPLVQVSFGLSEIADDRFALPGLVVREVDVAWTASSFDLGLHFERRPDGALTGYLTYPTALFDADTAERMAQRYVRLLESVAATPARPISELELLPDAERRLLVDEWGAVPWAGEVPGCFPELFATRAAAHPDKPAVWFGDGELTYGELDARSTRLARRLRSLGLGRGATVGVCLERGPEAVVAMVGVLKSGAAYVPFDPANPADRLAFLVADARVGAVVARSGAAGLFPGRPVIDPDDVADESADRPDWVVEPGDAAYVIYTSGSTGRPKGVVVEHGSYAQHSLVIAEQYRITESDRVLSLASLAFDGSLEQIGAPLLAGATVLLSDPLFWTPEELAERLRRFRVTSVNLTPHYYRELMTAVSPDDVRSLRMVNVGADVVTVDDARRWHELGAPARFVACYGPTEATISSYLHEAAERDLGAPTLPIGRPVPGTSAHVLDDRGRPSPVGVPGELHLGGRRVARGYLGRPALTADRFVPDPFSGVPGARLYRTGDLARVRGDGAVEFLGRIDDQVKIRGFRIELGEVEAVLNAQPAVRAAAVVTRDLPDPQLVAYVVPAGADADTDALREALRAQLPEYMVPGLWVALPELPLTPSRKVDRAALPAPVAPERAARVAPASGVERAIADIWREVLPTGDFGTHDDFFHLGGHSLLATRVLSRLRKRFDVRITLRHLFTARTVAALAAVVEEAGGRG